ncbi:uncharacterized protein [Argopecten irradians]|uniref:uncharacterized protein n=1 Tax=Argopecten irradians TaxID=31199 RepID=UPI003723D7B0
MKPLTRWRTVHWVTPVVVSSLIFLTLTMVLVLNNREADHESPASQTFWCHVIDFHNITFHRNIVIQCFLKSTMVNQTLHLRFSAMNSEMETEIEIFNLTTNSTIYKRMWNINICERGNYVTLTRRPVTCAGSEKYKVDIRFGIERQVIDIEVKNIVPESSISLSRDMDDFGGNISYGVTCSVRSGCHPIHVILLGSHGNNVPPLYDVNLTCISLYNREEGWTMECSGVVMEITFKSISRLICRPFPSYSSTESFIPTNSLIMSGHPRDCNSSTIGMVFLDHWSCRVYHQCATGSVMMSHTCTKDMYFDSRTCRCQNMDENAECYQNSKRHNRSAAALCLPQSITKSKNISHRLV